MDSKDILNGLKPIDNNYLVDFINMTKDINKKTSIHSKEIESLKKKIEDKNKIFNESIKDLHNKWIDYEQNIRKIGESILNTINLIIESCIGSSRYNNKYVKDFDIIIKGAESYYEEYISISSTRLTNILEVNNKIIKFSIEDYDDWNGEWRYGTITIPYKYFININSLREEPFMSEIIKKIKEKEYKNLKAQKKKQINEINAKIKKLKEQLSEIRTN